MICKKAKTKLTKNRLLENENMEEVRIAVDEFICPYCAEETKYVFSFLGCKSKCLKCGKLFIKRWWRTNNGSYYIIKDLKEAN